MSDEFGLRAQSLAEFCHRLQDDSEDRHALVIVYQR